LINSPSDRRLGALESVVLLAVEQIQHRAWRAAKRLKSSNYVSMNLTHPEAADTRLAPIESRHLPST